MTEVTRENKDLIETIEKEAHNKEINVSVLVREYTDHISEKPLLRLVQDINERIGIYTNLLEEIKRLSPREPQQNYDQDAADIKIKFEQLGLIPLHNLPNPTTAERIVNYVLEKIGRFGRALVEIMAKCALELRREIRIDPSVTLLLEVELSLIPKFTIGVEGFTPRFASAA